MKASSKLLTFGLVLITLSVVVAGPAGAVTGTRELRGVWVARMSGFQVGQEVDWQYRFTVRKSVGRAGVAWEEWRDCAGHERACASGSGAGAGWSIPSRVLFALDPDGVVQGVGQAGRITATPNPDGSMDTIMVCGGVTPADAGWPSGQVAMAPVGTNEWGAFAVTGTLKHVA